jgi:hypothetical protein
VLRTGALAAVTVLQAAAALLLAIGLGAAAAAASAAMVGMGEATWAPALASFAVSVALTSLATAVLAFLLLPERTAVGRRTSVKGDRLGPVPVLLLAALIFVTILQWPAILAWWREAAALLDEIDGGPDPFGLMMIPAAMVYSLPALATLLVAVWTATAFGGLAAGREPASQLLAAGTLLQAGIIVVGYLTGAGLQELGQALTRLTSGAPPADTASAIDWIARHDRLSDGFLVRAVAIFGGYVFTLLLTRSSARPGGNGPAGNQVVSVPLEPTADVPAAAPSMSQASAAFKESQYLFRVRNAFIGHFIRGFVAYDVNAIPSRAAEQMSFAWSTGVLRREPAGPDLLHVRPAERAGLFRRAFAVTDPPSGSLVGTLVPSGAEWDLRDAQGLTVATATPVHGRFERARYVATMAGHDVCRFTWNVGLTVGSSEMEVEFLPAGEERFDRALAMALAPILEDRVRRARRK